jgi:G6PDH family F420-dependent oxidoreductase
VKIGYFLSSEEYAPRQLIDQARMAEQAGFDALWISDHYHPWNDAQGQSSFVWSMIGAIGQTCRLPVTTAVTCPTVRIHPAIVAQAAATSNVLLEGRFSLGVGTGEALNEHVTTARWPNIDVRLDPVGGLLQGRAATKFRFLTRQIRRTRVARSPVSHERTVPPRFPCLALT